MLWSVAILNYLSMNIMRSEIWKEAEVEFSSVHLIANMENYKVKLDHFVHTMLH